VLNDAGHAVRHGKYREMCDETPTLRRGRCAFGSAASNSASRPAPGSVGCEMLDAVASAPRQTIEVGLQNCRDISSTSCACLDFPDCRRSAPSRA